MHEYDDHYDEDHNYDDNQDKYKHYFKFDPAAWDVWGKWLYDAMNDIIQNDPNVWYVIPNIEGFPSKKFPVNSYFSNTGKDKNFQYLGNNYQGVQIWKTKYFIYDKIGNLYRKHIESNPVHFVQQPHYYKGMFDILN